MIVFVSYSSRNRDRVEELVLQLGQLGHDVQFESKVIGGEVTWQQVVESIQATDLFIATLSADTLISYTSRIEYDYARELNKYILLVALEQINTLTSLDLDVRTSVIDFSPANPDAAEALAAALNSLAALEPRPVPVVPLPNWNASLDELSQRIKAPNMDGAEQGAVLLNLRELLERHDTFAQAKNLLVNFSARGDLRPEIRVKTNRTVSQVRHVGSLIQKIQRRGVFLIAIVLSVIVSLVIIILSQVVSQIRAQRSVTLVLTFTTLTPPAVTSTFTPVQTRIPPTNTPMTTVTVIPSAAISPSPNSTSTASVALTNTSAPAAASSLTPIPPTSTPLLPTLTPTILQLATNTPRLASPTSIALVLTSATEPPPASAPTVTSTVTPTTTSSPTAQMLVAIAPTVAPTEVVSLVQPDMFLAQLINRNIYVGLGVEDSIFGVRVRAVGTNAKAAGVQVGDYILAVGQNMVRTRNEFVRVMHTQLPSSNITLRMRRDSQLVTASWMLAERDFVLPYPS